MPAAPRVAAPASARALLIAMLLLAGSCAPKTPPPPLPVLEPIELHHIDDHMDARLSIAPDGTYYAVHPDRGFARGHLTLDQMEQLQRAFLGFERLPTTFPAGPGGPGRVLSYGSHAIAGGFVEDAPELFQRIHYLLTRLADSFRWKQ